MTAVTTPMPSKKDDRVNLRIDAETKKLLIEAAEIKGTKLSEFLLTTAVAAAERLVSPPSVARLGSEDFCRVLDAIANPPAPTPYLVKAMRSKN